MGEVSFESHNMGPTFYRLKSFSFHVNWPSHSWDMTFWKFNLEIHPIDSYPFCSMSFDFSIPEIQNFLNLTLKIHGGGEMTMTLHYYKSRQFHITPNGINLSSDFRDMASTKSGPSAASFDKFWAMGKPICGKWEIATTVHNYKSRQVHKTLNGLNPSNSFRDLCFAKSCPICAKFYKFLVHGQAHMGQMTMTMHNSKPRQFHRTLNGENPSSNYRDIFQVWQPPTCTDRYENTPPARRAEG